MRLMLMAIKGPYLTQAQPALELCTQVLQQCARQPVTLDFTGVVQMSPSFTNALFFNLLHRMNIDELRANVRVENAAPHIREAINTAIARKLEHRAELSSYLATA